MDHYDRIRVIPGNPLGIYNPTSYRLLGSGLQGAVFQLSSTRCVKIYANRDDYKSEKESLKKLSNSSFFPKMYDAHNGYIVMEYIQAPTLEEYLKAKGRMPRSVTKEIVKMIKEMKRLGLTRLDAIARHIFVTEKKKLKVIDHVNSFRTRHSYPLLLMADLKKLGLLDDFMGQVKELDRGLYYSWKKKLRLTN